jgi:hypothetical protein
MTVTASREQLRDELKTLLSLLSQQYIRSWYSGLSKDEEIFDLLQGLVDDLFVKVCERSESVDWHGFIHEVVPAILLKHLEDFNRAQERQHADQTFAEAFNEANGMHDGAVDQSAYLMRVADSLLCVLLPYEELVSDVAYAFVRELLSEVLLTLYSERLSDVYLWDQVLIKLLRKPSNNYGSTFDKIHGFVMCTIPKLAAKVSPLWNAVNRQHQQLPVGSSTLSETALTRILHSFLVPSCPSLWLSMVMHLCVPVADMWRGPAIRSLLSSFVQSQMTSAALTRHAQWLTHFLFPDGKPSPARIVPSEETQIHLRLMATNDLMLDVPFFSDKQVTKVLLFRLLDAAMTTLLPELARQTAEQIKQKRIMIHQADNEAFGLGGISSITQGKSED